MSPHQDLVRREHAIFQAEEEGLLTIREMHRQLIDLWDEYQEMLKEEAC